jgi:hypothetical protein
MRIALVLVIWTCTGVVSTIDQTGDRLRAANSRDEIKAPDFPPTK